MGEGTEMFQEKVTLGIGSDNFDYIEGLIFKVSEGSNDNKNTGNAVDCVLSGLYICISIYIKLL